MTGTETIPGARARLLVVDDDPELRHMLVRNLQAEGYQVAEAATGDEVALALANQPPDLVLLDVMLAHEDGFELLAAIRRKDETPVILLTGKDLEKDRVLGLRLGADDYVIKPFSTDELFARIASVLRRSYPRSTTRSSLEFGPLSIDTRSREVRLSGELIETTPKEFDLLLFLASSPRQVFTREQLLAQVWGSSPSWQDDGTVTEHIRRIRRKIEHGRDEEWIRTAHGVGYCFEP